MEKHYNIGGHLLTIGGDEADNLTRITEFAPFEITCPEAASGLRLTLTGRDTVVSSATTVPGHHERKRRAVGSEIGGTPPLPVTAPAGQQSVLYRFTFEEVSCTFAERESGEYIFRMSAPGGQRLELCCHPARQECTLTGNKSPYLLRFALWIGYGLLTAAQHTVCVHASAIVCQGKAVLFLGESGTGKSTHTRLWQKHIPGTMLLNDDSPVVRTCSGVPYVYGSPWSGKTPCYRNMRAELAAVVRLSQAPHNRIRKLTTPEAFASLFPSCPPAFVRNKMLERQICSTLSEVLRRVPVYHLECLPNAEAAHLVFRTLYCPEFL